MRETTFTELRNHAKAFFDAVEEGETVRVYRNGRPVADIVPVKAMPAWKKPPRTRLLQADLSDADLCDLSQDSFAQTIRCLESHPPRALDALHVGSALVYQPDLFVSADRRQVKAAGREGLAVVDISR